MKMSKYTETNREFSSRNELFQVACELAGVPATKRQASKWRNRRGRAYAVRHQAVNKLSEERSQSNG